jgi:hypothetical protein
VLIGFKSSSQFNLTQTQFPINQINNQSNPDFRFPAARLSQQSLFDFNFLVCFGFGWSFVIVKESTGR